MHKLQHRKEHHMSPNEIKADLIRHGTSMRAQAKRLGVSTNAVFLVVHRRMVSRRIMEAVAQAIGKKTPEVFPEYFEAKAWGEAVSA